MSEYVMWGTTTVGFASMTELENVPDEYEIKRGVSRSDSFPPDAAFRMNPAHPRDVILADAVSTREGDGLMLVSPALREVIESMGPTDTEILPVTLFNHKDRVASEDYVIVNPTLVRDALDVERMEVVRNPLDPTMIMSCKRTALDAAKLGDAPVLFRPEGMETRICVREDLADAITEKGFTGVYFWDLEDVRS